MSRTRRPQVTWSTHRTGTGRAGLVMRWSVGVRRHADDRRTPSLQSAPGRAR